MLACLCVSIICMIYIYIHTHTHIYTHTHTHTHTHTLPCQSIFLYQSIIIVIIYTFKTVSPKGTQSWIIPEQSWTDAEAEAPILWPPDVKNWLIRKDPDAGKDWRWEEKGMTEDEMVGWHHQLTKLSSSLQDQHLQVNLKLLKISDI